VHVASKAFPQVALYFENSILSPDLPLLASAAANVDKAEQEGSQLRVDSRYGVGNSVARPRDGERTHLANSRRCDLVASRRVERDRAGATGSVHPDTRL